MTVPTDTSVTLYKEGVASPPLHPIDVSGWINLGWSYEKEEISKAETKAETKAEGDVIQSPNVDSETSVDLITDPVAEPTEGDLLQSSDVDANTTVNPIADPGTEPIVETPTARRRRS